MHRVEHSLHCDLFSRLSFGENLNQRLFLNGELMQLIHKEWPEFRPRPDKNNRRGNFDLVILSPNSLKESNIWDFINGRIEAPIVIEMGLNYTINHLEQDLLKLNNSNIYRGYLIHLARKEFIDSFEDIEYLLLDIENKYKNIKTAYANIENDCIKYKLLNSNKILKK